MTEPVEGYHATVKMPLKLAWDLGGYDKAFIASIEACHAMAKLRAVLNEVGAKK